MMLLMQHGLNVLYIVLAVITTNVRIYVENYFSTLCYFCYCFVFFSALLHVATDAELALTRVK